MRTTLIFYRWFCCHSVHIQLRTYAHTSKLTPFSSVPCTFNACETVLIHFAYCLCAPLQKNIIDEIHGKYLGSTNHSLCPVEVTEFLLIFTMPILFFLFHSAFEHISLDEYFKFATFSGKTNNSNDYQALKQCAMHGKLAEVIIILCCKEKYRRQKEHDKLKLKAHTIATFSFRNCSEISITNIKQNESSYGNKVATGAFFSSSSLCFTCSFWCSLWALLWRYDLYVHDRTAGPLL